MYNAMSEEDRQMVTDEVNTVLCMLGRHDYEFTLVNSEGVLLTCHYCGHQKLCLLKGEG